MQFKVENFTQPLTSDVMDRKNMTFASGGGGGSIVIAPHNPPVFRVLVGITAAPVSGAWVKLGSITIPLIGNRLLMGQANLLTSHLLTAGDIRKNSYRAGITFDGALPTVPGAQIGGNTFSITGGNASVVYQNPTPPPATASTTAEIVFDKSMNIPISFPFYKDTTGISGNHTIDLWGYSEALDSALAPIQHSNVYWDFYGIEQEVI